MPTRDVHEHVRRVLSTVDPSAELIETGRRFMEHSGGLDDSLRGDLPAWCLERIKGLTGAASFKHAARHRDLRSLLAFGYLGVSLHPEWRSAKVRPLMPVPRVLAALEPDFFQVLLENVRANAKESALFRARIRAAEREVAEAVARLAKMAQSGTAGLPPRRRAARTVRSAAGDAVGFGIGIVVVWAVINWVRNSVDGDK